MSLPGSASLTGRQLHPRQTLICLAASKKKKRRARKSTPSARNAGMLGSMLVWRLWTRQRALCQQRPMQQPSPWPPRPAACRPRSLLPRLPHLRLGHTLLFLLLILTSMQKRQAMFRWWTRLRHYRAKNWANAIAIAALLWNTIVMCLARATLSPHGPMLLMRRLQRHRMHMSLLRRLSSAAAPQRQRARPVSMRRCRQQQQQQQHRQRQSQQQSHRQSQR